MKRHNNYLKRHGVKIANDDPLRNMIKEKLEAEPLFLMKIFVPPPPDLIYYLQEGNEPQRKKGDSQ
jgi:hypothetical protein